MSGIALGFLSRAVGKTTRGEPVIGTTTPSSCRRAPSGASSPKLGLTPKASPKAAREDLPPLPTLLGRPPMTATKQVCAEEVAQQKINEDSPMELAKRAREAYLARLGRIESRNGPFRV
mmetsp:Transcript_60160/g.173551  ORF Transcript_60160/g.173551 Transcript_60160/m.173551 type:complete len:119 (-) Transcript_60160:117-473(-)